MRRSQILRQDGNRSEFKHDIYSNHEKKSVVLHFQLILTNYHYHGDDMFGNVYQIGGQRRAKRKNFFGLDGCFIIISLSANDQ